MVYVQVCMHRCTRMDWTWDLEVSSERVEHRYRYARSYSNHVSRRGECVQSKGPEGISGLDVINMDMDAGEVWVGLGVGVDVGVCVGWIICKPSSIKKRGQGLRVWECVCVCVFVLYVLATGCESEKQQRGCRTVYMAIENDTGLGRI